jgi:glycosyltransferase involved in cell wall biosynthesis
MRIATVYREAPIDSFPAADMSVIRWRRISEALAALGHQVDVIANCSRGSADFAPGCRLVPLRDADWGRYDVVKTLFHRGFETLERAGGQDHPFLICKLGSVVGSDDAVPGVHFIGEERATLFATQLRIAARARYVTVLTEQSRGLWHAEHRDSTPTLLVPTGVNKQIPVPTRNPYLEFDERVVLYAGNLYLNCQRNISQLWQERLNALGFRLRTRGFRLCVIGPGDTSLLDPNAVSHLGPVEDDDVWDYLYFADAGLVLAQGQVQHNESSKIYYYLRTGLPVVSEQPVPNNCLITDTGLGAVVPYAADDELVDAVADVANRRYDNRAVIEYMRDQHSWERRAQIYHALRSSNRAAGNEARRASSFA